MHCCYLSRVCTTNRAFLCVIFVFFFFNDTAPTEIYTLSLHDALPIYQRTDGFADTVLFEEVPLVRAARSAGRFVQLDAPIGVSPRRWERDGWVRRTLGNRLLVIGYMFGLSPDTLVRYYRFGIHKEQPEC